MSRTTVTCARCNAAPGNHARSMCKPCYKTATRLGVLADYPMTRMDRSWAPEATRRLLAGERPRQVAEALGIGRSTVHDFARQQGIDLPRLGEVRAGSVTWPILTTGPAPSVPPCRGKAMDFDGVHSSQLTPGRNPAVRDMLANCAACPLATRQWCLDVMDPRGLGKEWQGIAGGVVWSHGRVVYFEPGALEATA